MATPRDPGRAPLIEIFHSIQGEGRHVGEPMAFVRLATCPIRCAYCDTPDSYRAPARFAVAGADAEANPVTPERAVELTLAVAARSPWAAAGPLVVSVTGGEPLVFPGFVRRFGAALGDRGRVHLETAALDPDALAVALPVLAHLSADFKLPGTLLGNDDPRDAHVACIARAAARAAVTIDVKLVLTDAVDPAAIDDALARLAPFRERILLVLQPVTPDREVTVPVDAERVATAASSAAAAGFRFVVLPQVHKALGLR